MRAVVCGLALCAALLAASAAHAYRPPARVLVQRSMEKQLGRQTKTLKVEMETQSYDMGGMPRGAPSSETLLLLAPSSVRKESDVGDGKRVEVRAEDKVVVRTPGQPDKSQRAGADAFVDAVIAGGPGYDDDKATERLLRDAKALGVNPEIVSFARFDGRVAYLIGSKPWEMDKPQLWLDQDTLLLVRVVTIAKGDDGKPKRTDMRFLGWGSPVGGAWFPARIETWSDDKLVKRSIVRSVERNVPLDATLFSVR